MRRLTFVGITLVLLFFTAKEVGSVNPNLYNFSTIINLTYSHDVYLTYENGTPVFYVDTPKEFKLKRVYVCAEGDLINLVKSLGFKVRRDCDVLITTKDVKTDKKAVIFLKGEKGGLKNVTWIVDPLRLRRTEVLAYRNLSIDGEVLAVYEDGGKAVVKVGNKVYVGFEPSKASLANILTCLIVEKVRPNLIYAVFASVTFAIAIVYALRDAVNKALLKFAKFMSVLVVGIGGYLNLFDKDAVLQNDTRRTIYDYILENPGVHLRELCRELNISMSTATWHLKILEKAGLIKSGKFGNKIVYYPAGMVKEDLILMLTLDDDKAKSIIEYLINKGKAHLRKIARDLNMNVETVRYHMRRLERAGIVKSYEDGNRIVYSINPDFIPSLSDRV